MYSNPILFEQCKYTLQKLKRSRSRKNTGLILSLQQQVLYPRMPNSNHSRRVIIQKTQRLLDRKLNQNQQLVFIEPMDIEQSCKSVQILNRDHSTDYSSSAKSQKVQIKKTKLDAQKHQNIYVYLQDIKNFYEEKENFNFVYESYMPWHSQINVKMREILIDWIIHIHYKLNLSENTLHLAVKLLDRYCFAKPIQKSKYQLLGATSLYIASKYIEVYPPRGRNFIDLCGGAYMDSEIFIMESQLLNCLDFTIIHSVNLWSMLELKLFQQGLLSQNEEKTSKLFFGTQNTYYGQQKRNKVLLDLITILSQMSILEYHLSLSKPNVLSCCILYYALKLWYKNNKDNYQETCYKLSFKQILRKYSLNSQEFKQQYDKIIAIWKNRRDKKFKSILLKFNYLFNEKGQLNFN